MKTYRVNYAALLISAALSAILIVGCAPAAPPTTAATDMPTTAPTEVMTTEPTEAPTEAATEAPTEAMTDEPTEVATEEPTAEATQEVGPPTESEASEDTTGTMLGTNEAFAGFGPILLNVINQALEIDLETEEFTVFIPDAESAAGLDQAALMALAEDTEAASAFAGCYVAEGSWTPDMLTDGATVTMLSGDVFTVEIDENGSIWLTGDTIENARLANFTATANGVIYLIDGLLCETAEE